MVGKNYWELFDFEFHWEKGIIKKLNLTLGNTSKYTLKQTMIKLNLFYGSTGNESLKLVYKKYTHSFQCW